MKRIVVRIYYIARTAVRGLAASPVTSSVAIATIGVTLVLLGSFSLLLANMEALVDQFGDALHVTAFLEKDVDAATRRELAAIAGTVEGVQSVRIVSEEEALERFRSGVGRGGELLDGLRENPLPASLEITLVPERRSAAGLAVVEESLAGLPGIEDLSSGHDWVEGYLRAVALVRAVGFGLGSILGISTLLIVANTIRLAVFSRRDELEILALVGASPSFLRMPFLLEGIAQGALGGALAVAVLYGIFRLVLPGFEFGLELLLGGVTPRFFTAAEASALLVGGSVLGLSGSAAAVMRDWHS